MKDKTLKSLQKKRDQAKTLEERNYYQWLLDTVIADMCCTESVQAEILSG